MDVLKVPIGFFVVICGIVFVYGDGLQNITTSSYDTIVVGLGASGVAAASTLARAGRKVLGLEAQDRVGGRVRTVSFGDGIVELGAEWIHGERQSRVYGSAIKNNITLKKQNYYTEVLSSDSRLEAKLLLKRLVAMCVNFVEETPDVPELLGTYVTRRLKDYLKDNEPDLLENTDFVEELLEMMNRLVSNYEACDDWNDVSTNSTYKELEGYILWSWHTYGYSTIFDILLDKFQNGSGIPNLVIKLNTKVINISWPQEPDGKVSVQTQAGEVFTADNVIVTTSLGVLKASHQELFTQQLPEEKVTAIGRIPMGLLDKVIFSFRERWWQSDKRSFSFLWKKEDKLAVPKEDLWTTKISWVTFPMGSSNTLTFWTSGKYAKLIETLPEDVVKRKLLDILQKFLGANVTIPEPTGMVRTSWFTNPYTRGSYSYDDHILVKFPQTRATLAKPLLDSAGKPRVLFAGEATDKTHFSTVHGAIDTGVREALRLLSND